MLQVGQKYRGGSIKEGEVVRGLKNKLDYEKTRYNQIKYKGFDTNA